MGFAEEILQEAHTQKKAGPSNFAEEIFQENVERHFKKTDEISAITTKPIQKFTGEGGEGADFTTHLKQGFVDDPINKVKISVGVHLAIIPGMKPQISEYLKSFFRHFVIA